MEYFVYVPKNVVVEEPIQVIYLHDDKTASLFNHSLLVAEENSSVTYVENYLSTVEHAKGLANIVTKSLHRQCKSYIWSS